MHLLISAADPRDAAAAVAGGADIVDAKEPSAGALGAVTAETFERIVNVVAGRAPVSAALGDRNGAESAAALAGQFAAAGAAFVKIGYGDRVDRVQIGAVTQAAVRSAHAFGTLVVAVAYADAKGLPLEELLDLTAAAGAGGFLIDTADKHGPSLPSLIDAGRMRRLVDSAHRFGMFAAVAGKLTAEDLPLAAAAGADIVGVRGAACAGGRNGQVEAARVQELRARIPTLRVERGSQEVTLVGWND